MWRLLVHYAVDSEAGDGHLGENFALIRHVMNVSGRTTGNHALLVNFCHVDSLISQIENRRRLHRSHVPQRQAGSATAQLKFIPHVYSKYNYVRISQKKDRYRHARV